ncbi:MAG: hypothetical protein A3H69_03090 [Candidatus Sungbacteria bacterium RIFCSPLOWO2_02_FULL_47_9]|uniref:Prepilin peptidase A24 N-terminal domain-containing protein n=1 Tax=Candidatus Sungbacteria bacterium RIFCSPHIGHO2_01_FULL_47_32 TaxID=1802264 RepID=A0A1G2K333_9BACT|nr:MAG: Peptidase A24A domain protein [Parcubacteria group bacterium GW2011_GWA2_47_10]OGZ93839.1 MAG: hypothetical protein A2633_04375 [Candidatus Sungbacteria bacterium RIFCSPHIGHO2_01_FULL_47_32]OHA04710.1 MAG: hypothetical protein A3A28_00855 [Candidatus Sungbacteria bacterium RIFCSPLOWO2_01_FULL_47_32]OHA09071.1 MAG: hypothetical protein A3H69_03090 [Candidatus Sungbacteria bacterium RIFCSPLOWO2_02_FULL_47_9]
MATVLSGVFGLIVGSFLNVVIYRLGKLDTERSDERSVFLVLSGRSYCPHCHKTLRWFELVPLVSFFIQGGRCRSCKKRISLQYPLIEFSTAALFALIAHEYFEGLLPLW